MNLVARAAELVEAGMKSVPTRSSSYLGQDLVRDKGWMVSRMALNPRLDYDIVDMVLMGVELPKVYHKENQDGSYEIITNRIVPETILAVLQSEESKKHPLLYNLFWLANIQFVTFDPSVTLEQANNLVGF